MTVRLKPIVIHRGNCFVCGDKNCSPFYLNNAAEVVDVISATGDSSFTRLYQCVDLCPRCIEGFKAAQNDTADEFINSLSLSQLKRYQTLCATSIMLSQQAIAAIDKCIKNSKGVIHNG